MIFIAVKDVHCGNNSAFMLIFTSTAALTVYALSNTCTSHRTAGTLSFDAYNQIERWPLTTHAYHYVR